MEIHQIIFEFIQSTSDIIRVSQKKNNSLTDVIIEKAKPFIDISGTSVYIPPATFLQASKAAETQMTNLVKKYLEDVEGNIADLFCGVGTFSYPLAVNKKNKITSVDSSAELLSGFQETVNKNMIPNIKILSRNLFKYPLLEDELKDFAAIVFDPPRAGASTQVAHIKDAAKVIAISCNPHTFVNDANTLISNGYRLDEVTLVDQFTYSNHSELVALFTKS
jgi:23S rRNA (uracil1939-C5)-methyltransferase